MATTENELQKRQCYEDVRAALISCHTVAIKALLIFHKIKLHNINKRRA